MKTILFLIVSFNIYAGTCTSISRTNNSANTVLTSTKYNTDLNTVYSAANNLDAGCLTDGTLETGSLNTTSFATIVNAVKEGCQLSRTDANTIAVGKCLLTVNGIHVKTTASTSVTWGCSGCSSETASTQYYLYASATTSTSTSLGLIISTTAPGSDGFDGSGNRIIGRFFNDAGSNINAQSLATWSFGRYMTNVDNSVAGFQEVQNPNVDAGTCTSGSDHTRTLNQTSPAAWFASIGSNQITLLPGRYVIEWSAPYRNVDSFFSYLYSVTAGSTVRTGTSGRVPNATGSTTISRTHGMAYVDITSTTVYEIRGRCETTVSNTGLGYPAGMTIAQETYTIVTVTRLGDST